jgi:hypothetical protein
VSGGRRGKDDRKHIGPVGKWVRDSYIFVGCFKRRIYECMFPHRLSKRKICTMKKNNEVSTKPMNSLPPPTLLPVRKLT